MLLRINWKWFIFNTKLEWGCPNGTKYPPRQPIPNRAILLNRVRLQTDGQTDGQGDSSIPPNFVVGGGGGIIT